MPLYIDRYHLRMQDGSLLEIFAEDMKQEYGFLTFSTDDVTFFGLRVDTVRTWENMSVKHKPVRVAPGVKTDGKKAPVRRS